MAVREAGKECGFVVCAGLICVACVSWEEAVCESTLNSFIVLVVEMTLGGWKAMCICMGTKAWSS